MLTSTLALAGETLLLWTVHCWKGRMFWGSVRLMCDLPGRVQRVAAQGQASLPGQLVIVTDKGKTSKEQGNLVVKEAMCAMLQAWDAPFRWAALQGLPACAPDRSLLPYHLCCIIRLCRDL